MGGVRRSPILLSLHSVLHDIVEKCRMLQSAYLSSPTPPPHVDFGGG